MVEGFPKWAELVGRQFGQNGQKLHENYKINILGQNSGGHGGGGGGGGGKWLQLFR